jgi:hypothetical protein
MEPLSTALSARLRPVAKAIGPGSIVQAVSLSFQLWTGPFLGMAVAGVPAENLVLVTWRART